jgi:hypothetical protein
MKRIKVPGIIILMMISLPLLTAIPARGSDPESLEIRSDLLPSGGTTLTEFNFTLGFNRSAFPSVESVYVLIDNEGSEMEGRNGSYYHVTNLTEGSHNHSFVIITDEGNVSFPESGSIRGPDVIEKDNNTPPVLEDPSLQKVPPYKDRYEYEVNYSDPDGDPPDGVYVVINGTGYRMTHLGRKDFFSGVRYSLTVDIPPGNHTYSFMAVYGNRSVILPENSTFRGPDIPIPEPTEPPEKDEVTTLDRGIAISLIVITLLVLSLLVYVTLRRRSG